MTRRILLLTAALAATLFIFASKKPLPPLPADLQANAQNLSFARDIAPIFEASCRKCHIDGQAGGISLKSAETSGAHIDDIIKETFSGEMPYKGTPLPQSTVDTIRAWQIGGLKP